MLDYAKMDTILQNLNVCAEDIKELSNTQVQLEGLMDHVNSEAFKVGELKDMLAKKVDIMESMQGDLLQAFSILRQTDEDVKAAIETTNEDLHQCARELKTHTTKMVAQEVGEIKQHLEKREDTQHNIVQEYKKARSILEMVELELKKTRSTLEIARNENKSNIEDLKRYADRKVEENREDQKAYFSEMNRKNKKLIMAGMFLSIGLTAGVLVTSLINILLLLNS